MTVRVTTQLKFNKYNKIRITFTKERLHFHPLLTLNSLVALLAQTFSIYFIVVTRGSTRNVVKSRYLVAEQLLLYYVVGLLFGNT